jgi:hypothetical protein
LNDKDWLIRPVFFVFGRKLGLFFDKDIANRKSGMIEWKKIIKLNSPKQSCKEREMDFIDQIRDLSARISKQLEHIQTEEAT